MLVIIDKEDAKSVMSKVRRNWQDLGHRQKSWTWGSRDVVAAEAPPIVGGGLEEGRGGFERLHGGVDIHCLAGSNGGGRWEFAIIVAGIVDSIIANVVFSQIHSGEFWESALQNW